MRSCAAALLLTLAVLPAQAQVYKWVDARGQANYSNAPPASAAGSAQRVEEKISILGMDPYVRADAEHRFAVRAAQEERDWQLRQQAMAARQQYASAPAPLSYFGDEYAYPYYGGAYYGGGYYRPARWHRVTHHGHANLPRVTPYARPARSISRR